MDDVFINEFVKRDKENGYAALVVILKAFTSLDLKVRSAQVQSVLTGAGGRSVWLDIEAEDEQGRIIKQRRKTPGFSKRVDSCVLKL